MLGVGAVPRPRKDAMALFDRLLRKKAAKEPEAKPPSEPAAKEAAAGKQPTLPPGKQPTMPPGKQPTMPPGKQPTMPPAGAGREKTQKSSDSMGLDNSAAQLKSYLKFR